MPLERGKILFWEKIPRKVAFPIHLGRGDSIEIDGEWVTVERNVTIDSYETLCSLKSSE